MDEQAVIAGWIDSAIATAPSPCVMIFVAFVKDGRIVRGSCVSDDFPRIDIPREQAIIDDILEELVDAAMPAYGDDGSGE